MKKLTLFVSGTTYYSNPKPKEWLERLFWSPGGWHRFNELIEVDADEFATLDKEEVILAAVKAKMVVKQGYIQEYASKMSSIVLTKLEVVTRQE